MKRENIRGRKEAKDRHTTRLGDYASYTPTNIEFLRRISIKRGRF